MESTKMQLQPSFFADRPHILLTYGPFTVTTFLYKSGIAGLKVDNGPSQVTFLPYLGQQIWRAVFNGLDVTMKSIFDEPLNEKAFELTYGNFLMHCGLSAMGNVGEEDTHEPHGELPCAVYDEAWVTTGADERGRYITVGGTYRYRNGLEFDFAFTPEVRLYEGEARLEIDATAASNRSTSVPYMYMCHVNWRPFDGARLVYSAPKDQVNVSVEEFDLPPEMEDKVNDFTRRLVADPSIADVIDPATQTYFPELCCWMPYKADENGVAHSMQVLPDGRACYVGFDTEQLGYAVRWIARTGDEDSCGFCLPCTSNQLGYTWAKKHDRLGHIPAKGSVGWHMTVGLLEAPEAKAMEDKINKILA